MAGIVWTNEELEYLKNNYIEKSCKEIAQHLNRTTRSVQHKFGQLGLERPHLNVGDSKERLTILEKFYKRVGKQNKTFVKVICNCENKTEFTTLLKNVEDSHTKSCGCLKSEVQRKRAIERNYKHGQSINGNILFKRWCNLKFKYKFCEEWKDFAVFEKWCFDNNWNKKCHIKRYDERISYNPDNCCIINKNYTAERLYKIWQGMFIRCYYPSFKQYCSYGARGIEVCKEWRNYLVFKDWSLNNGYKENLTIDKIDNNYHYCPENCRWATLEQQVESKHNNRQILAFGEVKSLIHWTKDIRCVVDTNTLKHRLLIGWKTERAITTNL